MGRAPGCPTPSGSGRVVRRARRPAHARSSKWPGLPCRWTRRPYRSARVAVGGAQGDDHRVAGGNLAVLFEEAPGGQLEGTVVAEEFVDRAGHEVRVVAQAGELGRVAEEGDQGGGDLVGDRFLAGHEELEDHRVQLLLRQLATVAGHHQAAEEIVVPVVAFVSDDVGDIALQAVQPGLVVRPSGVGGADRLDDLAPVLVEAGRQFCREPDDLGEDLEGEGGGERGHEIGGTRLREGVDEGVGQFLEAGPQPLDTARGERVGDEAPHPRVLRRVLVQQVHLELGMLRLGHDRGALPPAVVAAVVVLAEAVVVQRGVGGLVAGDEPRLYAAGEEDAVDRAGLAHPLVQRVGVGLVRAAHERDRVGQGFVRAVGVRGGQPLVQSHAGVLLTGRGRAGGGQARGRGRRRVRGAAGGPTGADRRRCRGRV